MSWIRRLLGRKSPAPPGRVELPEEAPQVAWPEPADKPWERPGTNVGEEIVGPDGSKYVWVPAGEFMMGSEDGADDETPVHPVQITGGFWLGKCEVTNAQYRRFCRATGRQFPADSNQGDDHPVVEVSWEDAQAYCAHYDLRLPTEAQWEYAARGPEGNKYPWGDQWDKNKCCSGRNPGPYGRTCPVGSLPQGASWCGALDMVGNVWEWCADWFDGDYYSTSPPKNPQGPMGCGFPFPVRIARGGAWDTGKPELFRCAHRNCGDPSARSYVNGFRCVRTVAVGVSAPAPTRQAQVKEEVPPAPSPVLSDNPEEAPQGPSPELSDNPWDRPGTSVGEEIVGPDGADYVWVPPGEFMMGAEAESGFRNEVPGHHVQITKGFWLGKCEVTNAQYRRFCQETGRQCPAASKQGDDHPVVAVTWDDAKAYCDHYGLRLPTEAQWEYAARGPEGREYPWGNECDKTKCCTSQNKGPGGRTFPVGSFPQGASWCGALDMAGNVWEYCADWYDSVYYSKSPVADPLGPEFGGSKVVRGGCWDLDPEFSRCAFRFSYDPSPYYHHIGFRCARGL